MSTPDHTIICAGDWLQFVSACSKAPCIRISSSPQSMEERLVEALRALPRSFVAFLQEKGLKEFEDYAALHDRAEDHRAFWEGLAVSGQVALSSDEAFLAVPKAVAAWKRAHSAVQKEQSLIDTGIPEASVRERSQLLPVSRLHSEGGISRESTQALAAGERTSSQHRATGALVETGAALEHVHAIAAEERVGMRRVKESLGESSPVRRINLLYDLTAELDIMRMVANHLDVSDLFKIGSVDGQCRAFVNVPGTWRGRGLDLTHWTMANSYDFFARFHGLLKTNGKRFASIKGIAFPLRVRPAESYLSRFAEALPNLRELRQSPSSHGWTEQTIQATTRAFPNIEELHVYGLNWDFATLAPLPHLRVLCCHGGFWNTMTRGSNWDLAWSLLPQNLPCLQVLRIPVIYNVAKSVMQNPDPEVVARMDQCIGAIRRMPRLQDLNLSGFVCLSNVGLGYLGEAPMLEKIMLHSLGSIITGAGITSLMSGRAPLKMVDCSNCISQAAGGSDRGFTSISREEAASLRARFPETLILS